MQTELADFMVGTQDGDDAQAIIGKCVHCGFCTATCPTYQLLGDELDGPRGRIYLIKQMVEGQPVTRETQLHLDRCLTCRNCETTCPSGVQYSRLLDIGRRIVETKVERPMKERVLRYSLAHFVPERRLFSAAMELGRLARPFLSANLQAKMPVGQVPRPTPIGHHARKMLFLEGCVQPAISPNINVATRRVLDALGIELIAPASAGCCGAIRLHLSNLDSGLDDIRRNIDAWWPYVEQGVDAIVMNASGCGATVKEYGHLLRDDPVYAEKANRIVALTKDLAELLPGYVDKLRPLIASPERRHVTFHPPCTLQHGQQIKGAVEGLLRSLDIDVRVPSDAHLCCGSAGTYSISQPALASQLRNNKVAALEATEPELIVSANIGCISHLAAASKTPVRHWIELVDDMLSRAHWVE
ncbi:MULTISPECIES: glycolate oxidase subunit GlcF [Paraburkholderia]|uniref:Glycolate oxidase iron-sulfur subunit n=1 Tax=Paraburkholderia nemoris TaxID=2793076 RepID=A0ABN7NAW6_9BURK|nr:MULTISPECIES: glycolate oxidase subunit GlcF [Paraburkholderia]KPD15262.1 glycolate oxidase iron-sulfur subunit [Burkholderia sp. ST111]MBK5185661.1 glycolate oxidase subunit GlcF [Burkholderia sp. R-69749]MBK3744470.1 glycolate oxidase subunit GlcF [Paraburkholderia aspalathi]MBK3816407.1 glycolate oxidase subunit GlcF [Paraburkholderia aspalathi]CAE6838620.1 Lactate utilization protein A [Paraburkholderia nemoris]